MLTHVLSVHTLLTVFIVNGCWVFFRSFAVSIEMIIWFLFVTFWVVCHIDLFSDIELSLHPWSESCLIIVYTPFRYYYIWFANTLLGISESIFIIDVDTYVCVCVCVCVISLLFVWEWYWPCRMSSIVLLTLWFLEWLRRIDINSVNVFLEFICETVLS